MSAKSKSNKLTVVLVHSESGDDYGPFLFSKKPTDAQLKAFLQERCPGEFEDEAEDGDGPGEWGSYLHVRITEREVLELK